MSAVVASALHVLALAVGLPAVFARGRALRAAAKGGPVEPVLDADNWWGLAALLWIGSGLWRLLGGLEKPTDWYLVQPMFHAKAACYVLATSLEIWPMVTFIRWRMAMQNGVAPDLRRVGLFWWFNQVELSTVVLMVFVAAGMARGVGFHEKDDGFCGVQRLLQANCVKCHGDVLQQAGLNMQSEPREHLVGKASSQWPDIKRVVPGQPDQSLMLLKLKGAQGPRGLAMPPGMPLEPEQVARVEKWIAEGAGTCPPP